MTCCFLPALPLEDEVISSTSIHLGNARAKSQKPWVKSCSPSFPSLPTLGRLNDLSDLAGLICKTGAVALTAGVRLSLICTLGAGDGRPAWTAPSVLGGPFTFHIR